LIINQFVEFGKVIILRYEGEFLDPALQNITVICCK